MHPQCGGSNVGFPGGPLPAVCSPIDAQKAIGAQTFGPVLVPTTFPVALDGGNFFVTVTGPSSASVIATISRDDAVGCPGDTYSITVDGVAVATVPAVGGTVVITAAFTIPTGTHSIGIATSLVAGECGETILGGSAALHVDCFGTSPPVLLVF